MSITIYHNPRCSKSRQALQLLQDKGVDPEVVEYLKTPCTAAEIEQILRKLGDPDPRVIMRKKEKIYREAGLDDESLGRDDLIGAMAQWPSLVERPIVVSGDRAIIGRPPENVLDLL
jgi:arsenate reductase